MFVHRGRSARCSICGSVAGRYYIIRTASCRYNSTHSFNFGVLHKCIADGCTFRAHRFCALQKALLSLAADAGYCSGRCYYNSNQTARSSLQYTPVFAANLATNFTISNKTLSPLLDARMDDPATFYSPPMARHLKTRSAIPDILATISARQDCTSTSSSHRSSDPSSSDIQERTITNILNDCNGILKSGPDDNLAEPVYCNVGNNKHVTWDATPEPILISPSSIWSAHGHDATTTPTSNNLTNLSSIGVDWSLQLEADVVFEYLNQHQFDCAFAFVENPDHFGVIFGYQYPHYRLAVCDHAFVCWLRIPEIDSNQPKSKEPPRPLFDNVPSVKISPSTSRNNQRFHISQSTFACASRHLAVFLMSITERINVLTTAPLRMQELVSHVLHTITYTYFHQDINSAVIVIKMYHHWRPSVLHRFVASICEQLNVQCVLPETISDIDCPSPCSTETPHPNMAQLIFCGNNLINPGRCCVATSHVTIGQSMHFGHPVDWLVLGEQPETKSDRNAKLILQCDLV